MSNYVTFQVTFKKDVTDYVTTDVATSKTENSKFDVVAICTKSDSEINEDFESDNSDGEEPSTEYI